MVDYIFEMLIAMAKGLIPVGKALLILIGGWIFARLLSSLIAKILTRLQLDRLAEKLNQLEIFLKYKIVIKPVAIIKKVVYWVIMLITIMAAADFLGLDQVSSLIDDLVKFIPELLKALLILLAGIYGASLNKRSSRVGMPIVWYQSLECDQ